MCSLCCRCFSLSYEAAKKTNSAAIRGMVVQLEMAESVVIAFDCTVFLIALLSVVAVFFSAVRGVKEDN